MRLHITLTGDVTVSGNDGTAPQIVSGPARIVLTALVIERPAGVGRDELAGILWPDAMPRTWASALRTHVSRTRSALIGALGTVGEVITASELGYQLALPADVEILVDVEQAADELAAARSVLPTDPATALGHAEAAATRVTGPLLPGHTGAWVDGLRARVEDTVVGALQVASEAAGALDDPVRAVAAADEATQRAPLNEAALRALMAALDAAGNRAEALRAYQRARHRLAEALGVDPSAETEAAYLALLGPTSTPRQRPTAPAGEPSSTPVAISGAGRTRTPFVGRGAELALLTRAWARAAQGARHVVVVTGEAGIGKTRLATEAAQAVTADGGQVLFGRCDQEAIVPYQPIVEALDGLVATTPVDDLPPLAPETLGELAAILPGTPAVARATAVTPPDRGRLFAAVTDLIAALATTRPLLLVLDDLQWADDDTLLLLRHLLRRAGTAPVLVVAISRDHDLDPGSALAEVVHALDRDGWVERIPLRGLAEADVARLLVHFLGSGDHRTAARKMVAETAGNPFLVTELGSATAAGAPEGVIPPGVQDLVASRLARLDPPVADLLQAGAIAGATFDLDLAAAVAGLDERDTLDAADAALATGLVFEDGTERFRFAHDLVRRTLEGRSSGVRRRALHRRTADEIERLHAADLDAHVAALAHHAAAGAEPGGDERAVRWARRAAAQASARRAPAEAVRLSRQALDHVPPGDGVLLARTTTELGVALLAAGDPSGAEALADGAALAYRHGASDVLGTAALALSDAADERPSHRAAARELVRVALDAGPPEAAADRPRAERVELDDAVRRARLLVRALRLDEPAAVPVNGGDGGVARPPTDGPAGVVALHRRLVELSGPEHLALRRQLVDELSTLADVFGDERWDVLVAHHQAMAAAESGDASASAPALARLDASATQGEPFAVAMAAERTVASLTAEGRVDDARTALAVAVEAAGKAAAELADDDQARPLLDPPDTVLARHKAVLDWLVGTEPPASVLLRATTPPADGDGASRLHDLAVDAIAAVKAGRPAGAAEVRNALAPYADRTCGVGYRTFAGSARFHLGRLAAAAGDWSDAERHLQAALREHTLLRARPWVALTQRALAQVLEARGRSSDREWIEGLRAEADHVTSSLGLRSD